MRSVWNGVGRVIDLSHAIPVYGQWKAYSDTMEALEDGDITPYAGGAYLGTLYAAATLHQIHMAEKSGRVSQFAISAVSRVQAAPMISLVAIPITLAGANIQLIENAPEEEQKGLWQMFASGLTGTFGVGSGLNL